MKKLFCAFAAVIALLFPCSALAATFDTKSFDVDIKVNLDNSYEITENISVDIWDQLHGIYRSLPKSSEAVREVQGTVYRDTLRLKYTDISADGVPISVENQGNTTGIYLGDADEYVTGEQDYTLHYTLHVGDDGMDVADEFYYNFLGNEWDSNIEEFTFRVTMPAPFDAEKVYLYKGSYGSPDTSGIEYQVDGQTITGRVVGGLSAYEAITCRIELPEGYYTQIPSTSGPYLIVGIVFLVLAGIGLLLFFLFGRDKQPVKTVEFYAPEGMTSADVGYLIDGASDTEDVVSLILYWASKGYLEIIEGEKKGDITLRKIKGLDADAKVYESTMFTGLFASGNEVKIKSLRNVFYTTVNTTKKQLENSLKESTFTHISRMLAGMCALFVAVIPIIYFLVGAAVEGIEWPQGLFAGLVIGFVWLVFTAILTSSYHKWKKKKSGGKIAIVIATVLFIVIMAAMFGIATVAVLETDISFGTGAAFASTVFFMLLTPAMRKYSDQGVAWLGKILGLRDFIEAAELPKIEALIHENPSYFYDVLPFAYALGLTDTFAKQFESIAVEPPNWYYGHYSTFNTVVFIGALNRSMNQMNTAMISTPNSGGHGGSFSGGGGGFSGGGVGGGGGGGW